MSKKQLLAAAVTAALATGVVTSGVTPLFAADNRTEHMAQQQPAGEHSAPGAKSSVAQATSPNVPDEALIKVSDDALVAMRNLVGARIAIFNGLPDEAQTYIDAAVTRIGATVNEASQYELDKKEPIAGDIYVPYDVHVGIAETFERTPEHLKQVDEAKEHLKKGEKQEAREAFGGGVRAVRGASYLPGLKSSAAASDASVRSTSANTISIVPMSAIRSDNMRPLANTLVGDRFIKEGPRTLTRKGWGLPSLMI